MKPWTKILPYWFIAWYARRNCEIFWVSGGQYVCPYPGVLIRKCRPDIFTIPTNMGDIPDGMSLLK